MIVWNTVHKRCQGVFVSEQAQYSYRIRAGKLAEPIRDATLIGTGPEVLSSIDMVANDLGFGVGTCGKDGQGVPVADAQPTLRIPRIVVGGTAAAEGLEPGDRIVLYSDGFIEQATTDSIEQYGERRLEQLLISGSDRSGEEMVAGTVDALAEWAGSRSFVDDMSLVVVEWLGS